MPAVLKSTLALPLGMVDSKSLIKALTIAYRPMGEDEDITVNAAYVEGEFIHVPRQFGITYARQHGIDVDDQTSHGHPMKFPKVPKPREYQVDTIDEVVDTADLYYDFRFRARTGWGKTIGSLIVASRIGKTTLVVVDQENLKDQWVKALVTHFGLKESQIGVVQGDKLSYRDKPVTIAMVQTLRMKKVPDEFWDYFGLLIVDETHVIGAPTFSTILPEVNATHRIGISATPNRRDGLQKMLDWHLGKVRVWVADEHSPSSVYVLENDTVYSWYANSSPKMGRFINEIAEDGSRNLTVATAAAWLYDTGRDVLVLSDRISQLKHLESLCYYLGVPAGDMGLYVGESPAYMYDKDPKPLRRPKGWEKGTEYTPIKLQLISKKMNTAARNHVKDHAKIIFATYGMFSKGTDVPRLSGGVDASPRSQAEQIHGRILRGGSTKTPLWLTMVDMNSYRSVYSLLGRIPGYEANNATVYKFDLDQGVIECESETLVDSLKDRHRKLKSMQIETNRDGLSTLKTKASQIEAAKLRVSAIKKKRER